ncbi:metal ABC transporter ATP-binding protein [Marinomonas sp. 2405UD66-6]|uniref:metal ABC transporter ATP-binding protein n=1 Tax=Marinomonas sp. 2405UD66-6 TaxID=3391834 RepID=UPI0039C967D7
MNGPSLLLENVAFYIQNQPLLATSSAQFYGGGWHGIAGPNGGGKSTLLKAVAGLLNHKGKIALHWPNSRGNIGYMPQLAPFDASLPITSSDFIRLHTNRQPVWQRYKKDSKVEAAIEKVGIRSLLSKRVGTLSTGERQRVLLACALLNEPDILLLDEPMAGVDKQGREQIIQLLGDFKASGGTLIMVEHDWQIIQECCDTLAWVDGALIDQDIPNSIFTRFQTSNNPIYQSTESELEHVG